MIMLFSGTIDPQVSADEWTDIFKNTFTPAVEAAGYTCVRVTQRPSSFLGEIVERLDSADLVVSDLTGSNPNVFYELGIRHARRVGTILVAQDFRFIPSDLRTYWALQYTWKTADGRRAFARDFRATVQQMQADPIRSDSPVFDVLGVAPVPQEGPLFRLLPGNSSHIGDEPNDPHKPATYAHVQVFNNGPFVARVRCAVSFLRPDGSPRFPDATPGRWSGNPEPLSRFAIQQGGNVQLVNLADMSKLPGGEVKDFAQKKTD